MYKAKITKINTDSTYQINIPSLGLKDIQAHSINTKGQIPTLAYGDLVLVSELNDQTWVIMGYVYGQKNQGILKGEEKGGTTIIQMGGNSEELDPRYTLKSEFDEFKQHNHDDSYSKLGHTHDFPVTSVNSKTGAVNLTYVDVGAAAVDHNHDTRYYQKDETDSRIAQAVSDLVNSSPEALDTLGELAAALGNDANFSTTVLNLIGQKVDRTGDTMTGPLTVPTLNVDTINGKTHGNAILRQDPDTGKVIIGSDARPLRLTGNTERPVYSNNALGTDGEQIAFLSDLEGISGDHTHNKVQDIGNSQNTTFAYSKEGLNYDSYTWLAGWNGYELRAIDKAQFARSSHTHPEYLPINGGIITTKEITTTNGLPYIAGARVPAGQLAIGKNGIAISNPETSNDAGWIRVLGSGEEDTILEIATGDDGGNGEKIVVRQYNTSNVIAREVILLDTDGTTTFPGKITAPGYHNFVSAGNELNLAGGFSGELQVGYRDNVSTYLMRNGSSDYANIRVKDVYSEGCVQTTDIILNNGSSTGTSVIKYKNPKYTANILILDGTDTSYNHNVTLTSGGRTIIGSGESADSTRSSLGANQDSERMYVTSDEDIYLISNCQEGYTSGKTFRFLSNGNFDVVNGGVFENNTRVYSPNNEQNHLPYVGHGNGNFTVHQTSGAWDGSGADWASYLICNHGDGSSYYNQTIRMPFWGSPQYQRREDGVLKGWKNFYTEEFKQPSLPDKTNNTDSYLNYGRTGIESWTSGWGDWFCGWDGYTVVPVAKKLIVNTSESQEITGKKTFTGGIDAGNRWSINYGTLPTYPGTYTNASGNIAFSSGFGISQGNQESSGIWFDGDGINMWSPCDRDAITYYDEDDGSKVFRIDSSGNFYNKAGTKCSIEYATISNRSLGSISANSSTYRYSARMTTGSFPEIVTIWGLETAQYGGIAISSSSSYMSDSYLWARSEGEQGYWGKQYLFCSALIPPNTSFYIWTQKLTSVRYARQPLTK